MVDQAVGISVDRREVPYHPTPCAHPRHDGVHLQSGETLLVTTLQEADINGIGGEIGTTCPEGRVAGEVFQGGEQHRREHVSEPRQDGDQRGAGQGPHRLRTDGTFATQREELVEVGIEEGADQSVRQGGADRGHAVRTVGQQSDDSGGDRQDIQCHPGKDPTDRGESIGEVASSDEDQRDEGDLPGPLPHLLHSSSLGATIAVQLCLHRLLGPSNSHVAFVSSEVIPLHPSKSLFHP